MYVLTDDRYTIAKNLWDATLSEKIFRTFLANSLDAWTPTTTFWDFLAADLTETKLAVNDEVKADIFILVLCV